MEHEECLKAALADRYQIEREIGSGGMATVYLAEDVKHHRKVAVKVLRPELAASLGIERFVREIGIAANLTHPHIPPLFDSGEADGFLYYVMPFIEGESLRVISRTSAMLLKGSQKDVPTIARELNVRYVLEGSVRWAGSNLRITSQLIEAATDAHLWAEKYTGTLEDVFDLQEQLSRSIVEALKVTLTPDEDRHLASRDIPDAEAYALYIRARQELLKLTEESLDLAEQLLERALARTGPNALLLATAAEIAYSFQDMGCRPAAEMLDRGDALATRALELDHNLAEAHVAKGLIAQRRFDTPASVRHILRAVDLDPADAWPSESLN